MATSNEFIQSVLSAVSEVQNLSDEDREHPEILEALRDLDDRADDLLSTIRDLIDDGEVQ